MVFNENIKILPDSHVSVSSRVSDYLQDNPTKTLIRLDQEMMNMPLPENVICGMKKAVEETAEPFGQLLSSPWSGYDSVKKAVTGRLGRLGVSVPESDVFMTSGLESAYSCLSQLFASENTVLIPDPGERRLVDLHRAAGRNVTFVRATPENAFRPLPDLSGADLIHLSSPSPVTGVALTREELGAWVDMANETGSLIIFDASLSEYSDPERYPRSIYEVEGAQNCAVELFSFEKGYGVRELKIAYVIIPSTLSRNGTRIQPLFCARQPATSTPPSFVMQRAAELLFSPETEQITQEMFSQILEVSRILSDGLTRAGIPCVGGDTGPFLWAQCPFGWSAWQFFDFLMEEAGCVVTPGSRYGYTGENFVRITAFGHPEEALEAVEKLVDAMKRARESQEKEDESRTAKMLLDKVDETESLQDPPESIGTEETGE